MAVKAHPIAIMTPLVKFLTPRKINSSVTYVASSYTFYKKTVST